MARTLRDIRYLARTKRYPFIPNVTAKMEPEPNGNDNERAYNLEGRFTLEVEFFPKKTRDRLREKPIPWYRIGYITHSPGGYWDPPDQDYATTKWSMEPIGLLLDLQNKSTMEAIYDDLAAESARQLDLLPSPLEMP